MSGKLVCMILFANEAVPERCVIVVTNSTALESVLLSEILEENGIIDAAHKQRLQTVFTRFKKRKKETVTRKARSSLLLARICKHNLLVPSQIRPFSLATMHCMVAATL